MYLSGVPNTLKILLKTAELYLCLIKIFTLQYWKSVFLLKTLGKYSAIMMVSLVSQYS